MDLLKSIEYGVYGNLLIILRNSKFYLLKGDYIPALFWEMLVTYCFQNSFPGFSKIIKQWILICVSVYLYIDIHM